MAVRGTTTLLTCVPPTVTGTSRATATSVFALLPSRALSVAGIAARDCGERAGESPARAPVMKATSSENKPASNSLVGSTAEQLFEATPLAMQDLSIIQKTNDLIRWYVPILNRLPRDQRFAPGDRITAGLYDLLEGLILARYASRERVRRLEILNGRLDVLRHQTRLLLDFDLIKAERYRHAAKLINDVGVELGGWIKQQRKLS